MKPQDEIWKSAPAASAQTPDMKRPGLNPDELFSTLGSGDIISLILQDHLPLKKLLRLLKNADAPRASKEANLEQLVPLLTAHAKAEQETLYVRMKENPDLRVDGFTGFTEHEIADALMQAINSAPDDDDWSAKVKVLATLVEEHIKNEEEEFLPEIQQRLDERVRKQLGMTYAVLKEQLSTLDFPLAAKVKASHEHRLNS